MILNLGVISLKMENMIDLRRYLNRFGYYIYTGDPTGDLEMIKDEIFELYEAKIIDKETFTQMLKVLAQEEKNLK
jgi:uncharacterized protein YqgQ